MAASTESGEWWRGELELDWRLLTAPLPLLRRSCPPPSLGDIVFNDKAKRKKLTSIVNPEIAKVLGMAFVGHFIRGTPVLVLDVPLLFETGINQFCTEVMTVHLDESTQLKRLMARDNAGEADAKARIASQVSWATAPPRRERPPTPIPNPIPNPIPTPTSK